MDETHITPDGFIPRNSVKAVSENSGIGVCEGNVDMLRMYELKIWPQAKRIAPERHRKKHSNGGDMNDSTRTWNTSSFFHLISAVLLSSKYTLWGMTAGCLPGCNANGEVPKCSSPP